MNHSPVNFPIKKILLQYLDFLDDMPPTKKNQTTAWNHLNVLYTPSIAFF